MPSQDISIATVFWVLDNPNCNLYVYSGGGLNLNSMETDFLDPEETNNKYNRNKAEHGETQFQR